MKILLIDNYDSFTYNLAQYFEAAGAEVTVRRNDEPVAGLHLKNYDKIVLSPGPGHPRDSKATLEILKLQPEQPVLGVCLGHQAMAEAYGGRVIRAKQLLHGKTSKIFHRKKGIFKGVENPFSAVRYHSLIIDRQDLPDCLEITAETEQNEIMGVQHRTLPIYGVQFHPESILTQDGKKIMRNFYEV
ncbi:MAG: aminodeoxychorismate/anthranilate synthase component II [Candidatus Micrarchaeota archaeon]